MFESDTLFPIRSLPFGIYGGISHQKSNLLSREYRYWVACLNFRTHYRASFYQRNGRRPALSDTPRRSLLSRSRRTEYGSHSMGTLCMNSSTGMDSVQRESRRTIQTSQMSRILLSMCFKLRPERPENIDAHRIVPGSVMTDADFTKLIDDRETCTACSFISSVSSSSTTAMANFLKWHTPSESLDAHSELAGNQLR